MKDKNKLKRNYNVVMTISLTNNDNDLKVSFNVAVGGIFIGIGLILLIKNNTEK